MWVWHKPFSNDCFSPLPIAIFWLFQKSPHWPSMQNFLSPHVPGARIPWLGISMWGSDPSHFVENLCNCTYPFFFFLVGHPLGSLAFFYTLSPPTYFLLYTFVVGKIFTSLQVILLSSCPVFWCSYVRKWARVFLLCHVDHCFLYVCLYI